MLRRRLRITADAVAMALSRSRFSPNVMTLFVVAVSLFGFIKLSRVYADAHSDDIYGDFIPEQPVDGEHGAISVAEAGRHVAILGTLLGESLTAGNDPSYYLAVEADVSGAGESVHHAQPGDAMTAYVRRRKNTANRLTVDGKLLYKNNLLFTFVVPYVRLGEIQFRFLYRDAVMPTFTAA